MLTPTYEYIKSLEMSLKCLEKHKELLGELISIKKEIIKMKEGKNDNRKR